MTDKSGALPADRATHEQSRQGVSAVPVGIPSAGDELPPEIVAQLSKRYRRDDVEAQILRLFSTEAQGIDAVLIGMWRTYRVVLRRTFLMAKLHRMAAKGRLEHVPGERGTYRLPAGRRL